jgi:hypothetical protein
MLLQWRFVQYDIDQLAICLTESLVSMTLALTTVQHLIAHVYQQDSVATIGWQRQLNLAHSSLHYCCNNKVAAGVHKGECGSGYMSVLICGCVYPKRLSVL